MESSVSERASELRRIEALDAAWAQRGHGRRLAAAMEGAAAVRAALAASPAVTAVRTLPLTTLMYPTRYAFWGAALSPAPYVVLTHRALLVRFRQGDATRTLLFNPTDIDASRRTPFFTGLIERFGPTLSALAAKRGDALEAQLARLGVSPDEVDYVAFDHFHTQDLRGLLGTADGARPPRFPNAKLLAPRAEWEQWSDLHPMQRAWFVPDGLDGVNTERVVLTDEDLSLGDGVALIRTPGHTVGNQTLFFKTERGVWGCSENGTCADNWSPQASRVAGLARAAREADLPVILNGNTPEYGADQMTSMLIERALVDPVPHADEWVQMFPSSEVTPSVTAPGLSPSYQHVAVSSGELAPAPDPEKSSFGA
ncbi:MAG: hypothetical protein R3A48_27285 [Polyangiales bacterium]